MNINIAALREAIALIHDSIAYVGGGSSKPKSDVMGMYLDTSSKLMDTCVSISNSIYQAQASERHLAAILGCLSSCTISEAQALRATKLLGDFKRQQKLISGLGRGCSSRKSKSKSATMEEDEEHVASLAKLCDVASLWMLNYSSGQKINLAELEEASKCVNRLLKTEIGGEEMRGYLKQLRQHVEDLATHLEPSHAQIRDLFQTLLATRKDLLSMF